MYWIQVGTNGDEFILTGFDRSTSTATWTPSQTLTVQEHERATHLYKSVPLHTVIEHLQVLPSADILTPPILRRQQAGSRLTKEIFLEGINKIHLAH